MRVIQKSFTQPDEPNDLYSTLREKNVFGINLARLRKQAGLSLKQLSERLGAIGLDIQLSSLNKWEKGIAVPNVYQLFALCQILEVQNPLSVFFDGSEASAPRLNREGMKRLQEYEDLLASSQRFAYSAESETEEPEEIMMKVYDLPASAGYGDWLDDNGYTLIPFPAQVIPDGTDFGVRVSGDSMQPRYANGQIVWVKACESLPDRAIGVFVLDGESFVKQYLITQPDDASRDAYTDSSGNVFPQVTLHSLNAAYAPRVVRPEQTLYIVGQVLN